MHKLSELTNIQKTSLFNSLRVSFTHHSSAIEGITLTYGETKRLLETGISADSKPMHEQLVVLGFADCFDFVLREAANVTKNLDTNLIKDMHAILFEKALKVTPERIEKPVGAWRLDERFIKGVDIKLTPPNLVDQDLNNLLYQAKISSLNDIAKFHIDFELIHPFADGNGRVGRLITTYQAIQNDIVPPLILDDHRKEYLDALGDADKLEAFLDKAIDESMKLVIT